MRHDDADVRPGEIESLALALKPFDVIHE